MHIRMAVGVNYSHDIQILQDEVLASSWSQCLYQPNQQS